MSASRQARRQLGRSLKALGKAPLCGDEIAPFNSELGAVAEDVRLAAGRCAACLSMSGERKSCHACSFVRYCNRECQTAGWPSHKLVCRVLAADREIVSATKFTESTPLLPLDTIWERLRGGGHAEAHEATAHLYIWAGRCELVLLSAAGPGHINAFSDEIAASGGLALLVKGLAAGGLRAMAAAGILSPLVSHCPEMSASILAAGALPALLYAIGLPSKHADLRKVWSILAAADDSALLVGLLGSSSSGLPWAPAIVEAGGVPVLVEYLTFTMRDEPQLETHRRVRDLLKVRFRAISAVAHLFAREDTGDAFKESTARACIASGASPPLLAALGGERKIAGRASLCLAYIVSHSGDRALAATLGKDRAPDIVAVLAGDSDDVKHGAVLLQAVVALAPETRTAVVAAGALRPLAALLRVTTEDGAVEAAAASVLGALCQGDPVQDEAAVVEASLEPLLALLKRPSTIARESAAWALSSMLKYTAIRDHKERVLAGGAVRILAECLAEAASTGDSRFANSAAAALTNFFAQAEDGSAPPLHASIADQILEAIPSFRLVNMIGGNDVSVDILRLLGDIAASPGCHGALVGAKLPRALAAVLVSKAAAAVASETGLQYVPVVLAIPLLYTLLRGPEAVAAADAVTAADGFPALANALGEVGEVAGAAAECLLAVSELGERRHAALVAAGAVPRLLALLAADKGEEGPDWAKRAAARTLLNLMMTDDASVAAEAAAAGFDAARLRQLAGFPDEPAAPSST